MSDAERTAAIEALVKHTQRWYDSIYSGTAAELVAVLLDGPDAPLRLASQVRGLEERLRAVTDERNALARIVGDLWDYPPPHMHDGTPNAHSEHLRERWGDFEAGIWNRLYDPPNMSTGEYDGWAIDSASPVPVEQDTGTEAGR